MILQVLGAFAAVVAGSILLEAPKNLVVRAGLIGGIGWGTYLLLLDTYGSIQATFIAGLIISLLSHIFSRIFKTPVTMFFIPGFYPLVPGYKMYMSVYNFISGNELLSQQYLVETVKISGMIALAIFTIDTFFNVINKLKHLIPQD